MPQNLCKISINSLKNNCLLIAFKKEKRKLVQISFSFMQKIKIVKLPFLISAI